MQYMQYYRSERKCTAQCASTCVPKMHGSIEKNGHILRHVPAYVSTHVDTVV